MHSNAYLQGMAGPFRSSLAHERSRLRLPRTARGECMVATEVIPHDTAPLAGAHAQGVRIAFAAAQETVLQSTCGTQTMINRLIRSKSAFLINYIWQKMVTIIILKTSCHSNDCFPPLLKKFDSETRNVK